MKCVSKPVGAPKRATFATGNARVRGSPNGLPAGPRRGALQVCASMKELRDRIDSVKNTQKITDAMKLVAAAKGEICDMDGNCVDAAEDEIFKLTTKEGKFVVEREATVVDTSTVDGSLLFEQDPSQILDSLLPLYMNSQILRSLQESIASELAARMNAMSNASDNAKELKKNLTLSYNRQRQAKITSEIIEIVAGANA
eukprot:jgi/Pico_ML_1/54194/g4605.t1